jgi:hypothetical protein
VTTRHGTTLSGESGSSRLEERQPDAGTQPLPQDLEAADPAEESDVDEDELELLRARRAKQLRKEEIARLRREIAGETQEEEPASRKRRLDDAWEPEAKYLKLA